MKFLICSAGVLMLTFAASLMAQTQTPALSWERRSDWVSVKEASPAAKGDGVADDTAAIQKVLDNAAVGSVIYFPAGTYRITSTLLMQPKTRLVGVLVVGHGRDTTLVWDGKEGEEMYRESGLAHSRYIGLTFDGKGKASVGMRHQNAQGHFETEVGLRHMMFRNFTDTALIADKAPATAEVMIENCLFENCKRGIAFLWFNDYDYTIDGCEFRRCQTGVETFHGNTYIRNCRFEASANADIVLNPEHGCSVRRCVSVGSNIFIKFGNPVAPLTVQDCHVADWKNTDGAILVGGAPVVIFDCVFTQPPGKAAPIRVFNENQRLFISQNVSADTERVVESAPGVKLFEIPAGKRKGSIASADQRFLTDKAQVPTKVFDAKRDFGAKGDGAADDSDAIQKTIDAARQAGKGAIAYLPTGAYAVSKTLQISGSNYVVGGTGYRTGLRWIGAAGGTIVEIKDPLNVTLENIDVGSHNLGEMNNAIDILQTSSGDAPSSMRYDNVSVYGMYQKKPLTKGLCLRGLSTGSTVTMPHVQGNLRFIDAARATILAGNTYEGSVTVSGKDKRRDGMIGFLTHLGTVCTHSLYILDNHNFIAGDFYTEQADNGFVFEGSPDDPPGRITIQSPKLHLDPNVKDSVAMQIRNYSGRIFVGPAQFYCDPLVDRVIHTGERPLVLTLWASSFYPENNLSVQKSAGAKFTMIGNLRNAKDADNSKIDDNHTPDDLGRLAEALDDLRTLGEIDLRLNHPTAVGR